MTKWENMKQFLADYLQTGQQYKAGTVYQVYTEAYGAEVSRKDFEMFLRSEVMRDDGILRRAAHGIYELRMVPEDRGVLFTRGKAISDISDITDDVLYSRYKTDPKNENLYAILDDALHLTERFRVVLEGVEKLPDLLPVERKELSAIRVSTLRSMDNAVSGITAAMAWFEDHLEEYAIQQAEENDLRLM